MEQLDYVTKIKTGKYLSVNKLKKKKNQIKEKKKEIFANNLFSFNCLYPELLQIWYGYQAFVLEQLSCHTIVVKISIGPYANKRQGTKKLTDTHCSL